VAKSSHSAEPELTAQAAHVAQHAHPEARLFFRATTLAEPPKKDMIAFLEAETSSIKAAYPPRLARVQLFINQELHELLVDLVEARITVIEPLPGKHSYIDTAFMQQAGDACLADARVQEEIKSLNLPEGATVVVEPWAYATDGILNEKERWTMVRKPSEHRQVWSG
jgi:primary-amine oxidase